MASNTLATQLCPTKILGSVPFVANSQQSLKLARDMMYRSINLRLTGTVSTNQTTTASNIAAADEWGCVQSIELIANGGNVLRFMTPEQMIIGNYLASGIGKDLNTLSGNAGAYAFDSTVPLWLCIPGMRDNGMTKYSIDTTLNATLFDDLYIRFTFKGGATNINNSTTSTFSVVPNIEITADQSYFLNANVNPAFTLTQITSRNFNNVAPATNPLAGLDFSIPVGQIYAWFLLNSKNTGTTQDAANALSNGIIQSGVNQFFNWDFRCERRINAARVPLRKFDFTDIFNNTQNLFDAWTLVRFPRYGLISEAFSLRGVPNCDFYIQNNNTGNQDVTISSLTVIPTAQVTG